MELHNIHFHVLLFSFKEKEIPASGLYRCPDNHARKVQEQALAGMFVAAAIKDLTDQVVPFMGTMVRHYTMVAIAHQCGKCKGRLFCSFVHLFIYILHHV